MTATNETPNALATAQAANEVCVVGREVMAHMTALFTAIMAAAGETTQAHALAKVGAYLASDLGNSFDVEAERLDKALTGK